MSERRVPPGAMSLYQTPEHTFKGAGKWFRTQYLADRYAERNNVLRRARRAGFGISDEEIELFLKQEKRVEVERAAKKSREAKEREERDRLREELGYHPHATISHLVTKTDAREASRKYLAKANRERMTDSERLDLLRTLYRHRNQMSPGDLMIRIGNVLGEEL